MLVFGFWNYVSQEVNPTFHNERGDIETSLGVGLHCSSTIILIKVCSNVVAPLCYKRP